MEKYSNCVKEMELTKFSSPKLIFKRKGKKGSLNEKDKKGFK